MALTILRTGDPDLVRVQQNVAKELTALQSSIPTKRQAVTTITADYSVQLTDVLVLANPASDINVTLPAASTCVGLSFMIKNKTTDAILHVRGAFIGAAFQTVDGAAPYDIPGGTCLTCYSTGTVWEVV